MGNNELLLAISDIMDQKLDAINVRMDTMENKLTANIQTLDAKIDAVDERLSAAVTKIASFSRIWFYHASITSNNVILIPANDT